MKYLSMSNLSGYKRRKKMQENNEELNKRRRELELMLSVEHQMTDSSKLRLINKIMDLLEEELLND